MKKITNIILFFCFGFTCFSQEDTTKIKKNLEDLSLEELLDIEVYSASKKVEAIKEAPAILSLVTSQDILKSGSLTLIDVLKYVPCLEVSMGSDGNYRVAIRGSRKDGTVLVLINGQQINDFYSGRAIFDLPADMIDRVEVVRGPGSALFGTNAMAGVINIFTVEKTSISASVGPFGNINANTNLFVEKENSDFALSVGYLQNNTNNQTIEHEKADILPWSLLSGDKKFKTNRWNKDAYLSSTFKSKGFEFQVFDIYRQNSAYVGPVYIATTDSKYITNQLMSSILYNYKIGNNVVITPKFYYQLNYKNALQQEAPDDYVSVSGDTFANGKLTREDYLGTTYGGEVSIYIKINEKVDFMTGSVYENLNMNQYKLDRNYKIQGDIYKGDFANYDNISYDQLGKKRAVFAYYSQMNYKSTKWNLTAGLRYDDYSDFGQALNPRVGITYKMTSKFRLKALVGKAFRAPTFQELYDNTTLGNEYGVKGNTDLSNQSIVTYELGSEFNTKTFLIKYNLFYINNNNLIRIYDPHGGGSIGIYENIGNSELFGQEAELIIKFSPMIQFYANFSHYINKFEWNQENVSEADYKFFEKQPYYNKELRNMPTIRLNTGLNLSYEKFSLFMGSSFGNSSQNNKRFFLEKDHYVEIPYYLIGNFNLAYQATKKLYISLTANNIGTKYSDPDESTNIDAFGSLGLIQPGAMYLLNFKYNF
ncbi:MAG: TonB-dependent receptor [Bacteroidota bacterium]